MRKKTILTHICVVQFLCVWPSITFGNDWSGAYIGGSLGTGSSGVSYKHKPEGFWPGTIQEPYLIENGSGSFSDSELVGGLHVGYNFQSSAFVFGIEADINLLDFSEKKREIALSGVFNADYRTAAKLDWYSTVRGRVGYQVDRFLPYITGGIAIGQREVSQSIDFNGGSQAIGDKTDTDVGFALGAGVDMALSENWALRLEFMHIGFGDTKVDMLNERFPAYPHSMKADWKTDVLRFGVNYRF